ncbi:uncharacterized protein MYCFIDRAFT_180757 [Pseudocercospora fijiensis CIRAD86]|uniref:Uncharacterized protein n=1 Tax=Pseudocercospora fijiensis (strain CIRAD86) TaxID=383855 RepID=M2YG44_PSEFD|nr:uncharacterized protein MYCFIDRAFT_180757 [Pseudocercospora fijiensis CIRAD86]EME76770.1 hypothetical protein MYCFIDRAFT_180757 [Pseudocercospora fijiensis CIRAD86]
MPRKYTSSSSSSIPPAPASAASESSSVSRMTSATSRSNVGRSRHASRTLIQRDRGQDDAQVRARGGIGMDAVDEGQPTQAHSSSTDLRPHGVVVGESVGVVGNEDGAHAAPPAPPSPPPPPRKSSHPRPPTQLQPQLQPQASIPPSSSRHIDSPRHSQPRPRTRITLAAWLLLATIFFPIAYLISPFALAATADIVEWRQQSRAPRFPPSSHSDIVSSSLNHLRSKTRSSRTYYNNLHFSKRILCNTDYLNCAIQPNPREQPFFADVERRRTDTTSGAACPILLCKGETILPCHAAISDYLHRTTHVTEPIAVLWAQYNANLTRYISTTERTMMELRHVVAAQPWWPIGRAQQLYESIAVSMHDLARHPDHDHHDQKDEIIPLTLLRSTSPAWSIFRHFRRTLASLELYNDLQINLWQDLIKRLHRDIGSTKWAREIRRQLTSSAAPCMAVVEDVPVCGRSDFPREWFDRWVAKNVAQACKSVSDDTISGEVVGMVECALARLMRGVGLGKQEGERWDYDDEDYDDEEDMEWWKTMLSCSSMMMMMKMRNGGKPCILGPRLSSWLPQAVSHSMSTTILKASMVPITTILMTTILMTTILMTTILITTILITTILITTILITTILLITILITTTLIVPSSAISTKFHFERSVVLLDSYCRTWTRSKKKLLARLTCDSARPTEDGCDQEEDMRYVHYFPSSPVVSTYIPNQRALLGLSIEKWHEWSL